MPAIVANAKKFRAHSDYPADKVVWLKSGSATFATGINSTTVTHGLPFIPLVGGSWSSDADFTTLYDFYTGTFPSGNPGYLFKLQLDVVADSTKVTLTCTNLTSSSQKLYYRLFAFEPSSSSVNLTDTASSSDSFLRSSDYNVPKLYDSGVRSVPSNSGSTATSTIVPHGIGYVPQALGWVERGGSCQPLNNASAGGVSNFSLKVTTASMVYLAPPGAVASKFHYRVYLDE